MNYGHILVCTQHKESVFTWFKLNIHFRSLLLICHSLSVEQLEIMLEISAFTLICSPLFFFCI